MNNYQPVSQIQIMEKLLLLKNNIQKKLKIPIIKLRSDKMIFYVEEASITTKCQRWDTIQIKEMIC